MLKIIDEYQKNPNSDAMERLFENEEFLKIFDERVTDVRIKLRVKEYEATTLVYEALLDCLEKYDSNKKNSNFKGYFNYWVKFRLFKEYSYYHKNGIFSEKDHVARVSVYVTNYMLKNPNATADDVAKACNITKKMAINLMAWTDEMNSDIFINDEANSIPFDHDLDEFERYGELYDALKELEKEDDRMVYILLERFGCFDTKKMTLDQIGELSGITGECVRQIEGRALKKLKTLLEKD